MNETIAVPKALLQMVFDTAVGSMDFGSGFLGDDEVYALRDVAVLLGVDPMDATPSNYAKRMPHAINNNGVRDFAGRTVDRCRRCSLPAAHEIHNEPATQVGGGE